MAFWNEWWQRMTAPRETVPPAVPPALDPDRDTSDLVQTREAWRALVLESELLWHQDRPRIREMGRPDRVAERLRGEDHGREMDI